MLKAAIRATLDKMIRLNAARADFAQTFESLIESYNTGSRTMSHARTVAPAAREAGRCG